MIGGVTHSESHSARNDLARGRMPCEHRSSPRVGSVTPAFVPLTNLGGMKEGDPGREKGGFGIQSYLAYKMRCLS
jgi:hypothetical protein